MSSGDGIAYCIANCLTCVVCVCSSEQWGIRSESREQCPCHKQLWDGGSTRGLDSTGSRTALYRNTNVARCAGPTFTSLPRRLQAAQIYPQPYSDIPGFRASGATDRESRSALLLSYHEQHDVKLENELHQGQRVRLLRSAPDCCLNTSCQNVRLIPKSFSHSSLQVLVPVSRMP
jgi:hypothetical protein